MATDHLTSGDAEAVIDLGAGARLASLAVAGEELLVRDGPGPIHWGVYPMAPWAGRVRRGRFTFAGTAHQLPPNLGPHALHGTVFDRPWEAEGPGSYSVELGPPWPFGGRVRQEVRLEAGRLRLRLEVHAGDRPMPASCGWHPWLRRRLGRGGSLQLRFQAGYMLVRDDDGIATRERVPPPPGPWDDCFGGLTSAPRLTWPGRLELVMGGDCDYVVIYDEEPHAVCVEPQTHPPDALNHEAAVVEPGRPLVAEAVWSWRLLEEPGSPTSQEAP